jgi:hypothetical protein
MNNVDIKAAEPDRVSASYMLLMKSNCQIAFQPLSRADEILTFFFVGVLRIAGILGSGATLDGV